MKLLVCGDRNWKNREVIRAWIAYLQPELVIEGEARGADLIGKSEATRLKIPVLSFPAEWDKYGRAAGVIRNTQMLKKGGPDFVVAFHDGIEHSKGTANMVEQAAKSNIPYIIVQSDMNDPEAEIDRVIGSIKEAISEND